MKHLITLFFLSTVFFTTAQDRTTQVLNENQFIPDQQNGYYLNPIFPGNYGDPTIVRIDSDYYIAFSRGNGVMIWHSKDLVNWEPVIRHRLPEGYNTVWAIDMQYFNGMFHIYMPIRDYPGKEDNAYGNFVIRSKNPEGPWSDPINLEVTTPEGDYSGIDPGFIQTPDGEKYLYVSHGYAMKLNNDGTKATTTPKSVYDGWEYPEEWTVQCKCLESPKLFRKDDYYYMVSAEGGTSGPSTAHMSVVARAKHPMGPWENSPYNPVTHTYSQDEPFWHQGHGTIFEAANGSWWTVYHGRVNSYEEMGRPTLLIPIEWTGDGWPVTKNGMPSWEPIKKPAGEAVTHGLPNSDDFSGTKLGPQWHVNQDNATNIFLINNQLVIKARGENHRDGVSISQGAPNKSFEVQVAIEVDQSTEAGLMLGDKGFATDGEKVYLAEGPNWMMKRATFELKKGKVWIKIRNYRKDISFFWSEDGIEWNKFSDAMRGGHYGIRLFAAGEGKAYFEDYKYTGLE